jgi:hypothetical protein
MNDPIDLNQAQPTPEPPPATAAPAAFCQNCGKPLTGETVRRVGTAVFCEPCLAARIGQTGPGPGYNGGYRPVNAGPYGASNPSSAGPNPGLAALLGLIPGVGAFYNEQYAKGVVHVIVFMVLVSLADNVNGIFGLLVAAWIFYMAIEAHHTARARRDGTLLPNPFGLNDIGERLGFGRSWPAGPSVAEVANDAAAAAAAAAARASAQYAAPTYPQQPPAWGSADDYAAQQTQTASTQPFAYQDVVYGQNPGYPPAAAAGSAPHPPYAAVPNVNPAAPFDPSAYPAPPINRFPAGAVILIGLGTIFLLTTTGIFSGFPGEALVGVVLIGIGAWVFIRRLTDGGLPLAPGADQPGSPLYTLRILRALKWTVWLEAIGVLNLLDAFHLVTWHYTWPFLIILLGVAILIQRTAYQAAYNQAFLASIAPISAPDSSKGGL